MAIKAKITQGNEAVTQGAEQTVGNNVAIEAGGNIAIDVPPEAVQSLERVGNDLVVQMKDGQALKIQNFYGAADKVSHLYLVEEGQLVSADLGAVASNGLVTASYAPVGAAADFTAIAEGAAVAGAGGGGLSTAALLGGIGLVGGGVGLAAGGGGNDGDGDGEPPAPAAATDLAISATGSQLTGKAAAGTTVRIDTNGDGTPDATATVGTDGTFTIPLSPALIDGQTVSVTVANAAGRISTAVTTIAPDTTAPAAPSGVAVSADGLHVTGTGQVGSTIRVDTNGDGTPDATGTVGANGQFDITLPQALTNGETVSVTAADTVGNASGAVTATAPDTTAPEPPSDIMLSSDGLQVTGRAQPRIRMRLFVNNDDTHIDEVMSDDDGNFVFILSDPFDDGETISVVTVDEAGNSSPGATTEAPDTTAPDAPIAQIASDGTRVTGTAEAGSTVTISVGGSVQATVTANADGSFDVPLTDALTNGQTVTVTATDDANNTSDAATITAPDLVPGPDAPVIAASTGAVFTGTGDPGTTLILRTGNGTVIGETTVAPDGTWTITPVTPLPNATVVIAVLQDASGVNSPMSWILTDSQPPNAPVITPSNGTILSGTAEAGATISLIDGLGNPIGQATADASGAWTFTPGTPLSDSTVVNATAADALGNVSEEASAIIDALAPDAPVIAPTNGSVIIGTAEPDSTVTLTDGNGNTIAVVTTGPGGTFTHTPTTPLPDGTVVNAVAIDAVGNSSISGTVTVDSQPPQPPTIDPSNGTILSGTAEAGIVVLIDQTDSTVIGEAVVDGTGHWTFIPATSLPDGLVVQAFSRDGTENTSSLVAITIDGIAPDAPVIDISRGTTFTGTAEAGSTVILSDNGTVIGQATADTNGNWVFTPTTPVANGNAVSATATDTAGNVSLASQITVDSAPPLRPRIFRTNGRYVAGEAEPGSTVSVSDSNGVIGTTTADVNGNWQIQPANPIPDDTVLAVTATDAAGNVSLPETITVDITVPTTPAIAPTNGSVISGTGDAGNIVLLTDGNGIPLGQATVDGTGRWTFTPPAQLGNGTVIRAIAQNTDGVQTDTATTVVDGIAPQAPTIAPTNGALLTGTAEAGATVKLTTGNGTVIGQVTADATGHWTVTPATAIANGIIVNATATDAAGNTGAAGTATVDALAPAAPTIAPTNGVSVQGTGEIGSTIVLTTAAGVAIGTAVVNASGQWSLAPATALAGGVVVNAVARDAAGNVSTAATATVDTVPPALPVVALSNGTTISGTAEPGGIVVIRSGGVTLATTNADATGQWSFTPSTPLANGTVVSVVVVDPAGNVGPAAAITIDSVAPATPTINSTNGALLAGTAEANATVIITDGIGNAIGTTSAGATGQWSFTPGTPLANGTVVSAVARDATGNTSLAATTTVDSVAPTPPILQASAGAVLAGAAEAGSTVTLTRANGTVIATIVADANGNFSVPLSPALLNGVVVNATATDTHGNVSTVATITVDTIPPTVPTIAPTDGTVLSGTAEVGVLILLTDSGVPIGQVTVGANGQWSLPLTTPLLDGTVVIAVARDAAGNLSTSANVVIDSQAPLAPIVAPSNGVTLTGTGEAGATVTFTGPGGTVIGTANIGINGQWSFTPTTPLANGTVVTVTAADAIGNTSAATTVTVDAAAPGLPTANASAGLVLTGTAEPEATVTITGPGGTVIGTTVADTLGNWRLVPPSALAHGTLLTIQATDAVGNASANATLTIDGQAPTLPGIALSNGTTLSGTAEIGATVTLTDGAGNPIGQATAGAGGTWTFNPPSPLADGTIVRVTATDAAGNVSLQNAVTIDGAAPGIPVIAPSNGLAIGGTAEPGATVTVTGPGGTIGTTVADANGNWSITPGIAPANGVQISVTATDPTGNTGTAATITIDAQAPGLPTIAASNGVRLVGTAEGGATVTLTLGGAPLATVTADANGYWAFSPDLPLGNGAIVAVTATDAAGNTGPQANVTIDTSAPGIPVLLPSAGISVGGTAEVGSTVTVIDGLGIVLGTAPVDGAGNWTFTLPTPLANGAIVRAFAEDSSGNTGATASITIDGLAPGVPAITLGNGTTVSGTGEIGATILLTGPGNAVIGQTTVGAGGTWTFTPGAPLANGLVVSVAAQDAAGNTSTAASVTIDALAPAAPVIAPSAGAVLRGTAEIGSVVTLTLANGTVIGLVPVDATGNWAFAPLVPILNGVVINAAATDAAGNIGTAASVTVDTVAPSAPTGLAVSADGTTLTGQAEANSQIRIVVNGDTANPIIATVGAGGSFTVPLVPPLTLGQELTVTVADPSGNVGAGAIVQAPDFVAPILTIAETADGYLNKVEASNGIQVSIGLSAGTDAGDVIKLHYVGPGGFTFDQLHTVTAAERLVGTAAITIVPPNGTAAFPEGATTVTANIDAGPASTPVNFVVDTTNPSTPVASLVGGLLSLNGDPGGTINVNVNIAGINATAQVTTNAQGKGTLNLLTGLSIQPSWDDLLNATVSVQGVDQAGNVSNVANVAVTSGLAPVTLDGFGLAVSLLPLTLGISGTAPVGGTLAVQVVTPAATVNINPIIDSTGHYTINLLAPNLLTQLGLSVTQILNLGAGLGLHIIATDATGHQSADYGLSLTGAGLSLALGTITVTGTGVEDVLQGKDTQLEVFNSAGGSDLILHVGTGDVVNAGAGNDTIQISAANTGNIDGGIGFDTLMFDHGINVNYGALGVGTWHGIERIAMGKDGQASSLTLTAAQVNSITDGGNVLQITGDAQDTLRVTGAIDTGNTVVHDGTTYDVYTFGTTTLQVEHNTVVVVH